jgi:CobQ/CobB/MinD/ParA nucleotide binding domain
MATCTESHLDRQPLDSVYLVAGGKGGVGKSMMALVLIDQLLLRGKKVLYFETDTSNADVWFCLERDGKNAPGQPIAGVTMHGLDLALPDAWGTMLTIIDGHRDHVVVVGTASRTDDCIRQNGDIFKIGLPLIQRDVVTLWVIDEQRDAVLLLKDHLEVFPQAETHVIKNSKYGPHFPYYEGSEVKATIDRKDGRSLLMPRLPLCVVNSLYSDRLAISQALETLPIGNKVLLMQFRKACGAMLEPVLGR